MGNIFCSESFFFFTGYFFPAGYRIHNDVLIFATDYVRIYATVGGLTLGNVMLGLDDNSKYVDIFLYRQLD